MLAENRNPLITLKQRRDFERLFKNGRRFNASSWVLLNSQKNSFDSARFGWTVPKYVGTAVVRNRIKRWCREILRNLELQKSLDVNIVFRRKSKSFYKDVSYGEVVEILDPALRRLFS